MTKVLEFSFSISPSNEYSGLISIRIDWFNFLAVQGTLKSLLLTAAMKLKDACSLEGKLSAEELMLLNYGVEEDS